MTFHTPVMVKECLSYLNLRAGHIYVDATTGGGGHSLAMLKAQPEIKLYCFDQDSEAIEEAEKVTIIYDWATSAVPRQWELNYHTLLSSPFVMSGDTIDLS